MEEARRSTDLVPVPYKRGFLPQSNRERMSQQYLCLLLQKERRLKTVASVVVVSFA